MNLDIWAEAPQLIHYSVCLVSHCDWWHDRSWFQAPPMPAHRYGEENGSGARLAVKVSRCHMPLQDVNKAAHSGLETRGDVTKHGYQWPNKKDKFVSSKKLKRNKLGLSSLIHTYKLGHGFLAIRCDLLQEVERVVGVAIYDVNSYRGVHVMLKTNQAKIYSHSVLNYWTKMVQEAPSFAVNWFLPPVNEVAGR